jgi:hypothetical protein
MAAPFFIFFLFLIALVPAMASPKVLQMRFLRGEGQAISKRDTASVLLGNAVYNYLYYVNVTIGTPPQFLQLQINTGSSDV